MSLLSREENKCKVESGGILHYESNQLASNDPCEDRLSGGWEEGRVLDRGCLE